MTDFIHRPDGNLWVENLPLEQIATTYGSPTYVYSLATIKQNYQAWHEAVGADGLICYSVKANSNIGVLSALVAMGSGFDIVSIGELQRVLAAGGSAQKTIFSGVGKSRDEIKQALKANIACFNVESEAELQQIHQVAQQLKVKAPVSIRVNPDVDAKTHPYISTGLRDNKFGVDTETALRLYADMKDMPHIEIKGIDCHIGSQLTDVSPLLDSLKALLTLIDKIAALGIELEHIDLGGGLGVDYQGEVPPTAAQYLKEVRGLMLDRKQSLIFEPGRSIVAKSGLLLTRVQYLKSSEDYNFAVVDAAMNDYIRPALYQAWSNISVVTPQKVAAMNWDVVGPICESTDFLGRNRQLAITQGCLLAIHDCGAYGFSMSSNYNTRPKAAEVIVDGSQSHLVRARETVEDLFVLESTLPS